MIPWCFGAVGVGRCRKIHTRRLVLTFFVYPLIIIGSITGVYPLKIQHKTRYVKIEGLFNERYEFIQYRGFIVEETLGLGVFNLRGACCGILVLINYAAPLGHIRFLRAKKRATVLFANLSLDEAVQERFAHLYPQPQVARTRSALQGEPAASDVQVRPESVMERLIARGLQIVVGQSELEAGTAHREHCEAHKGEEHESCGNSECRRP